MDRNHITTAGGCVSEELKPSDAEIHAVAMELWRRESATDWDQLRECERDDYERDASIILDAAYAVRRPSPDPTPELVERVEIAIFKAIPHDKAADFNAVARAAITAYREDAR